ncbi:hypothetical protein Q8791_22990 [Nocardiopsis sp. CT-R113]|uniref:Uncharacterized protein n=1 Tax=Nocardiopsis codii TaxID=3065942 RepID=A0ABU7KDI0_9ACTN|nr:hypothetical protein [Nocardiopsis sp. CT-R113]MEE2040087.1 hypothetical protein [Nocardiopsis sp. CT-R113]
MSTSLPGMPTPLDGMPTPAFRPARAWSDYPNRIRVYGGRNPHAAREEPPGRGRYRQWTHRTACDRVSDAGMGRRMSDHLLPDTTPVACRACLDALGLKET